MEIIPYTPDLYEQLILFLVESFPNRDKRYFDCKLPKLAY